MKDRPILFSAPMVRAILEGRKTQTRRLVADRHVMCVGRPELADCPYGELGDRLWVRETWAGHESDDDISPARMPAAWDGSLASAPPVWYQSTETDHRGRGRWRPSIHMPRWASRITLRVTSVRVERLQAITPEDVVAEGVAPPMQLGALPLAWARHTKIAFANLWDQLNGARASWGSNPWVWVVGFEREVPT